ncbi:MAG: hypothetical protein ACK5LZ_04865 [Anaerorhabdus sp.]
MSILYDNERKQHQSFLEFEKVRDPEFLNTIIPSTIVYSNISNRKEFIDQYITLEKSKKYSSEKKSRIYGVKLNLLLPQRGYSRNELMKISARFCRYVIQEEKGLKCISYLRKQKKVQWLVVYFCDREWIDEHEVKYIKNIYRNIKTKSFCAADHPDAELIAEKGSLKRDANGNAIINTSGFKNRKSRKFVYNDNDFESFINTFKDFYTQSLSVLKEKLVNGLVIHRLNLKKAYNRFERRLIIGNNSLIQNIQNELNLLLQEAVRNADWRDIKSGNDPNDFIVDRRKYLLVKKTFEIYRHIFKSGFFLGEDETVYKIQGTRCDDAEENLKKLKQKFTKDLQELAQVL